MNETPVWIPGRLEDFAAGKRPEPKPVWRPPTLDDFVWDLSVQAYDQTLVNTGYVKFEITTVDGVPLIRIRERQTFRPKPEIGLGSFTEKFERKRLLSRMVSEVVDPDSETAAETPAVAGWETESSLLAASAIYDVAMAAQGRRPVLVSRNHVCSVLCNDPRASKADVRKAISRYLPQVITRDWNEHTRDALAVGITYLYDLKKARDER